MIRVGHSVCIVPGVLSAIASDICYLLKKKNTSGLRIQSQIMTETGKRAESDRASSLPFFGTTPVFVLTTDFLRHTKKKEEAFFISKFTEKPHQCIAVK